MQTTLSPNRRSTLFLTSFEWTSPLCLARTDSNSLSLSVHRRTVYPANFIEHLKRFLIRFDRQSPYWRLRNFSVNSDYQFAIKGLTKPELRIAERFRLYLHFVRICDMDTQILSRHTSKAISQLCLASAQKLKRR